MSAKICRYGLTVIPTTKSVNHRLCFRQFLQKIAFYANVTAPPASSRVFCGGSAGLNSCRQSGREPIPMNAHRRPCSWSGERRPLACRVRRLAKHFVRRFGPVVISAGSLANEVFGWLQVLPRAGRIVPKTGKKTNGIRLRKQRRSSQCPPTRPTTKNTGRWNGATRLEKVAIPHGRP